MLSDVGCHLNFASQRVSNIVGYYPFSVFQVSGHFRKVGLYLDVIDLFFSPRTYDDAMISNNLKLDAKLISSSGQIDGNSKTSLAIFKLNHLWENSKNVISTQFPITVMTHIRFHFSHISTFN